MSFFKKLADKVEDFLDDDKDKKKQEEVQSQPQGQGQQGTVTSNFTSSIAYQTPEHARGYGDNYRQGGYPQQYQQQQQQQPQGSYYGGAPPPQGPPAPYGAPPPMPPGWNAQWDSNQNRWYYIEQSTGRSQWDPPATFGQPPQGPYAPPVGGPPGQVPYTTGHGDGFRGESGTYYSGQGGMPPTEHQGQYGGDDRAYGQGGEQQKEKSGSGKAWAMGAGGLAVGAIGGAVIAHELTEDSDEEHHAAAQPAYVAPPAESSYQPAPNPMYAEPLPDETASGSSVSSSDREELEERREELQEAQEEYEEAYEETYD
ncbi:Uu.00g009870.m01.CDS01 [Anthostomella pinea]|uniref:Uu.00g009870.m01.CDS01 n=1 Tax=Anthostomella pinea TaxID=933095 RepID=A0AAI8VYP8_9PEZI|nr:Uu.00g009870.m01.CDS01 [Anthostomella pinea]